MKKKSFILKFEIDLNAMPEMTQVYEDEIDKIFQQAKDCCHRLNRRQISETGTTENGTYYEIEIANS